MSSCIAAAKAAGTGFFAFTLMLAAYFIILTAVSGWGFALAQFAEFRYFVLALAGGFGIQVGLYFRLKRVSTHRGVSGKVAAVSGGTSTAAMISCCTHYLANVLPILGATGLVVLVTQYQVQLFWVGLAFNLGGVFYIGWKTWQASRHMSHMTDHT